MRFIPVLSTLQMFESKEAVRGRLISPKTWDRIIGNFFLAMVQPVTVGRGFLGKLSVNLWIKWCFGMYRAGNGRETRVH